MALIEIQEVSKLYGFGDAATIALDEVNFVVEKNEFIAIMGPSGSGKSTLMNVIGLLDQPSHGTYKEVKVTKLEHSCLDITESNQRLIVDPGDFTVSLKDFSNIVAIVVTHVHFDHLNKELLEQIKAQNPSVAVYTTSEAAKELENFDVTVPEIGKEHIAGPFKLKFFGKTHEVIDDTQPPAENIGVLVNKSLYYPGDSYVVCPEPFEVLAAPKSGPWHKVREVLPLIEQSECHIVFGSHDGLLNEAGHKTTDTWLDLFSKRNGKEYRPLKPGESIDI